MAIEVRCIEHLSVEQRQSLYLLYGPPAIKVQIHFAQAVPAAFQMLSRFSTP